MRRVIGFLLVMFLVLSSTGLATDFAGIQILGWIDDDIPQGTEILTKAVQTKTGEINFIYKGELANPDVYVLCDIGFSSIAFYIHNESKIPIQLNAFLDQYLLITEDESFYILEIRDWLKYPSGVINPNGFKKVSVKKPKLKSEMKYFTIALPLMETVIFLIGVEKAEE